MNNTTLRVYDGGKKYAGNCDRYSLYYPLPRAQQAAEGLKGYYLGFSFNADAIITACHGEVVHGLGIDAYLGKKVQVNTLPSHVQIWIAQEQKKHLQEINA